MMKGSQGSKEKIKMQNPKTNAGSKCVPPSGHLVELSSYATALSAKRVKKSDVFSRTSFYIFFISCFWVKHLQKYTRKEP